MGNGQRGQPLILSDGISPYTRRECAILTRFNSLHVAAFRPDSRAGGPFGVRALTVRTVAARGASEVVLGPWSSTPVPGHDRWRVIARRRPFAPATGRLSPRYVRPHSVERPVGVAAERRGAVRRALG